MVGRTASRLICSSGAASERMNQLIGELNA